MCKSDGSGYGECLCGGTGAAGASSEDSGAKLFPHIGPYSGLLGAACTSATDCRSGFDCITANSKLVRGEGPSAGMCLTQCLVAHDFCSAVDATAQCIVLDDRGTATTSDDLAYCLPGCKIGTQPDGADKCRGRADLVCTQALAGSVDGYCRPACRSDIDCAPLFCDLATGLCADSAPTGPAIGSACDPSNSQCPGGCIAQENQYTECSGVCSFGTEGCGRNGDPPYDALCAIGAATSAGEGDLGYCAKLCDCNDDCARTDAVCEPRPDLKKTTGRAGLCGPKLTTTGKASPNLPCAG